nr:MFS transporter [Streptomyces sp. SBT349]
MNGRFRGVVAAHAVSAYGNYLNLVALSLFSYQLTGNALGIGLLMALRLFSGLLAGLGAAALTARVGRRRVMIGADLAQAVAMAVIALATRTASVGLLAAVVVVLGAGNVFFTVALRSAIPVMVGQEARGRANGQLMTGRSLAMVAGFASAGPLIGIAGHGAAFAVNAASFLLSAATLLVLRPRTEEDAPAPPPEPGPEPESGSTPKARGLPRGWTTLPALLLGVILLRGADALASSSHNVALPVVAGLESPENPAAFMARFWAAWAVGTLLAHQALKRRPASWWEGRRGAVVYAVGTCAMSLFFVLAFTGPPPVAFMLIAALAGFADGATEIAHTSRLQAAPDAERGRLFALSSMAETSGFALGTVTAAAALELWPAIAVVGLFHGIAFCGALALLTHLARRAPDGRAAAPPAIETSRSPIP